jgi:hypothetical protein
MWDSLSFLFDNVVSPALFLDIALRKIWQYSSGHCFEEDMAIFIWTLAML